MYKTSTEVKENLDRNEEHEDDFSSDDDQQLSPGKIPYDTPRQTSNGVVL